MGDIVDLASIDSNLPIKVELISVGDAVVPGYFVASSPNKDKYNFSFTSFKITYSDGSFLIIDPAHQKKYHFNFSFSTSYNDSNYTILDNSLKDAKSIYFTHMHWDHVNGVLKNDNTALIEKSYFSTCQTKSKFIDSTDLDLLPLTNILEYQTHALVSDGVVVFKTPGHTECSQSFYIKTVESSYVIFGDTVYNSENIEMKKGRSLLMSLLSGDSRKNRQESSLSLSQLIYFKQLGSVLLSSHDKEQQFSQTVENKPEKGWVQLK